MIYSYFVSELYKAFDDAFENFFTDYCSTISSFDNIIEVDIINISTSKRLLQGYSLLEIRSIKYADVMVEHIVATFNEALN